MRLETVRLSENLHGILGSMSWITLILNRSEKKLFFLLGLVLAISSGCNGTEHANTLKQVEKEGYTYFGAVPFEAPLLHQVETVFVGPEPALAKQISQRIGEELKLPDVEPFWIQRGYSGLISALVNDEVDFVISVLGRTPERERQVDFSETYYTSELVAVINPVRNDKIRSDNLARARIGVREGTAGEEIVRAKYPDAKIAPIETLDESILQLRSGDVDVVIDDRIMAAYSLATMTGVSHLEILPDFIVASVECGVALRKGQDQLLQLVNEAIRESKVDYQGWIDEQFNPDLLRKVMTRYERRQDELRRAKRPRRVSIRISKSRSSEFDIYRVANLAFVLRNTNGETFTSSKIDFQGRTGVSSVTIPPGNYSVTITKFNTTFGTLMIRREDPARITVNIRLQASGQFTMTRAS